MSKSREVKNREHLSPITIRFGDVCSTHRVIKKFVIVNVGEEEWFGGSVVKGSQGTESANVVSTTLAREDIKEIVDHWEVDRVIAAMLVYLGESNPNGALFDAVRKHASASPRILT